jgi:hypothetical protein
MPGEYNPAKEKPKVQLLRPAAGGVLRSEEGGVYAPVTPVRHFSKPRAVPHVLQPIDKARKRRFLKKVRRDIFIKLKPAPIVPYRHKLPAPGNLTYEQILKRAEGLSKREQQAKQQRIRQELIRRLSLAKQSVQPAAACTMVKAHPQLIHKSSTSGHPQCHPQRTTAIHRPSTSVWVHMACG